MTDLHDMAAQIWRDNPSLNYLQCLQQAQTARLARPDPDWDNETERLMQGDYSPALVENITQALTDGREWEDDQIEAMREAIISNDLRRLGSILFAHVCNYWYGRAKTQAVANLEEQYIRNMQDDIDEAKIQAWELNQGA